MIIQGLIPKMTQLAMNHALPDMAAGPLDIDKPSSTYW